METFPWKTEGHRLGLGCIALALGIHALFIVPQSPVREVPWHVLYPLWKLSLYVSSWDPEAGHNLNVLTGYWGNFVLVIVALGWGICRLRPQDAGLGGIGRKFTEALFATGIVWAISQIFLLVFSVISGTELSWNRVWFDRSPLALATSSIKAFLGVAFMEEILYRGLVLPQVFLALRRFWANRALIPALFISQIPFALIHIPHYDVPLPLPLGLFVIWMTGVLLAWMWLRTDNILIAVGWHGLLDLPLSLAGFPEQVAVGSVYMAGLFLLMLWRWLPYPRSPQPRR